MLKALSLFVALLAVASASPFTDCGSKQGKVTAVHISGCPDGSKTCILKKGTTVDIVVDFISLEDTNNATLKVSAIILGHEIQLLSEDACKNMGIQCPIKANQAYSGQTSVPIESSYPTVKLTVKGQLIDANGVDLACITIPAQISK